MQLPKQLQEVLNTYLLLPIILLSGMKLTHFQMLKLRRVCKLSITVSFLILGFPDNYIPTKSKISSQNYFPKFGEKKQK